MYYQEKVINGILSHRNTPDAEWIPFTAEALSVAYLSTKVRMGDIELERDQLKDKLNKIKSACA